MLSTTDAVVWAQEFVKTLREHPQTADPHDTGFMIGWFANAIETGRAAGERPVRTRPEGTLCGFCFYRNSANAFGRCARCGRSLSGHVADEARRKLERAIRDA